MKKNTENILQDKPDKKGSAIFVAIIKFFAYIAIFISLLFLIIILRGDYKNIRDVLSDWLIFSNIIVERDKIKEEAKVITLNQYIPPTGQLAELIIRSGKYNNKPGVDWRSKNIIYYQKITECMPYDADGYAMLGFCYYLSDEATKAASLFEKSIALNPDAFWPNYNLGIIYLKNENYKKARYLFTKAISVNPAKSVKMIHSSRIYQQILKCVKTMNVHLKNNFKDAYKDTHTLLIITQYFMGEYNEMLKTAFFSIKTGFSDKKNYYYAGLACYHLKHYKQALIYLRNAQLKGCENVDIIYYIKKCIDVINKRSTIKPLLPAKILKITTESLKNEINKVKVKIF